MCCTPPPALDIRPRCCLLPPLRPSTPSTPPPPPLNWQVRFNWQAEMYAYVIAATQLEAGPVRHLTTLRSIYPPNDDVVDRGKCAWALVEARGGLGFGMAQA